MDVFGKSPNGFLFKVTLTEKWLSLLGLQPVLCGPWSWICRLVGNMHPYYLSAVDSLYWEVPAKIYIYPTLVLPKHIWPSLFWPVKLYGPCSWICRYVGNAFLLSIRSEQFVLTVSPPKKDCIFHPICFAEENGLFSNQIVIVLWSLQYGKISKCVRDSGECAEKIFWKDDLWKCGLVHHFVHNFWKKKNIMHDHITLLSPTGALREAFLRKEQNFMILFLRNC